MEAVTVIRPGSRVFVGGDIKAVVLSATLEMDGCVSYRVAWWDGRARRVETLYAAEVAARRGDEVAVGFEEA